jgi:hypothetical protein
MMSIAAAEAISLGPRIKMPSGKASFVPWAAGSAKSCRVGDKSAFVADRTSVAADGPSAFGADETSIAADGLPETACGLCSRVAWNLRVTTSMMTVAASSPAKATRGQFIRITSWLTNHAFRPSLGCASEVQISERGASNQ